MKYTIKKLERELKEIENLQKRNEELRDKQYFIEDDDGEPRKGKVGEWKKRMKEKNDILKKYRFFNNPAISKALVEEQIKLLKSVLKSNKVLKTNIGQILNGLDELTRQQISEELNTFEKQIQGD